ncbi:hypothetical protein GCK72_014361 [Caenorhabditis remanei]|uniref:CRE-MESP-1 protein n=1 Tax=Caenorhabditis remanei TaxID=31234 RepID=E3MM41_CAERE|nr:hypothetical protein GCK72_014361 [Caenorhabditis remanei]EFP04904.1 CRE-MESP-1 protein [Caenorhabditis remanei]KAF1757904.1 hypothetical protein GCK72_014361 [Caenorhabditis remanei]
MIVAPKTPKGSWRRRDPDLRTPRIRTQEATAMPMSQFSRAKSSLESQISIGKQLHRHVSASVRSPPGSKRFFVPECTSTPALPRCVEEVEMNEDPPMVPIATEVLSHPDAEVELNLNSEPIGHLSPERRPSSAPLNNRSISRLPPRPRTAEPVEPQRACSPTRKRTARKCTMAKTPHCARPTISWRYKCSKEGVFL